MGTDEGEDPFDTYFVVRNERDHHSVWPTVKPIPDGWEALGFVGNRNQCLDWIEANWAGPAI